MTAHPPEPTDPAMERQLGRIAVWLDRANMEWLSTHCCCPADATEQQSARCGRLRFGARAALHKARVEGP